MFSDRNSLRKLSIGFAAATEVVVYILAGYGLGYLLDKQIRHTEPWLMVLFTLLGLIAGFYRLFVLFSRLDEPNKKDNEE